MKKKTAIQAGIVGALVMSFIMWLARITGTLPANLEMMLGTMIGLSPGAFAWIVGFVIHVVAGAVFGLIYAWCFERLLHQAGWLTGLGIGVVHTIVSGLFLAAIPALHPLIPQQMPAPGAFMAGLGALGVAAFAVLHLLFGAIVGGAYGTASQSPEGSTIHEGHPHPSR